MEQTKALKRQIGGDHYKKNVIQPWHIIDSHNLDFYEGNAVKYLLRQKGNRVEDLQKAIHYIERKIERLQEHEGQTTMDFCEDTTISDPVVEDILDVPSILRKQETTDETLARHNIVDPRSGVEYVAGIDLAKHEAGDH